MSNLIKFLIIFSLALLFTALLVCVAKRDWISDTVQNPVSYPESQEVMELVNLYRTENGLRPLIKNEQLKPFAETRIQEIRTDWGHRGFLEKHPADMLGYKRVGENLAKGYQESYGVLAGWIRSDIHNTNMLRPEWEYTYVLCEEDYCVQLFSTGPITQDN